MIIIIARISGIMWLNGVVWTLSTLLFGYFTVEVKLLTNYIKMCLRCFYDLDCGVVA